LSHELAKEVLVFDSPGQAPHGPAVGLLTLSIKQERVDIGLLAVDEHFRGQRIGQQLVQAAKQRTAAWGLPELQVVTQLDNERACNFYRHCGFQVDTVEHVYHLWL
jgi:dTDP-4-amino-4,6-dideoxy-D-galactose acyltransferase